MSYAVDARAGSAMRWRAVQLAGVQAIYLVRLLILARLLAPEAFGLLAIASVAISVAMRLSDVGMLPALVQRRDATPEQHDAAWTVGLTRALFVVLVLVAAAPIVAEWFDEPRAATLLQVLALRPIIDAAASIGIARLTRDLRFRELALLQVPGAVVDLVVAVATAPLIGVWALVAGALAGSATTTLLSYYFAPNRPRLRFRWAEIAPLVNYGRWVLATGVVGLAGTFAIQLGISRTLGAAALGLYFLALKVAFLPIEAAGAVVGAVAFPMFVRLADDPVATRRAFATLLGGLVLLLVPLYALVFVLSPDLEQLFGPRWAGTTPMTRVFAIAGVTAILGELLVPYLMGRGLTRRAFGLEVVQTGVLLAVLIPLLLWAAELGGPLAWLIGNAAALVVALVWVRRLLPGALQSSLRRVVAAVAIALAGASAAMLGSSPFTGLAGLVGGGLAGVTVMALLLAVLNARIGLHLDEFKELFMPGKR